MPSTCLKQRRLWSNGLLSKTEGGECYVPGSVCMHELLNSTPEMSSYVLSHQGAGCWTVSIVIQMHNLSSEIYVGPFPSLMLLELQVSDTKSTPTAESPSFDIWNRFSQQECV